MNLKDKTIKLDDKEKDLIKEEKELSEELKTSEILYKGANERFSKSIKNKNFEDASVAQALYEAAQKGIQDSNDRLQKWARLPNSRSPLYYSVKNVYYSVKNVQIFL